MKSLAWARARKPTRRGAERATSGAATTSATAPSEIREQSVRRSGGATIGFFSETVLQKSNPRSLRIWAYGLVTPLRWFLAAMRARVSLGSP